MRIWKDLVFSSVEASKNGNGFNYRFADSLAPQIEKQEGIAGDIIQQKDRSQGQLVWRKEKDLPTNVPLRVCFELTKKGFVNIVSCIVIGKK